MSCKCGSDRLLRISAKCSDLFGMSYKGKEYDGYVPTDIEIGNDGYGDYVSMVICLECGLIQGKFPVSEKKIQAHFKDKEE
jgi:hypothetical protein